MMRLFVNVDHVATVREARRTVEPDPVQAAVLAEASGADGITVHLREDRRHIQDHDLERLLEVAAGGVNLEVAAEEAVLAIAERLRPAQVTLVPEKREEITTEGGLDLGHSSRERVRSAVRRLRSAGIRTSLFVDPDPEVIEACAELEADAVELHTGEYSNAGDSERPAQLSRLASSAELAAELGLSVHAGHGLTYDNVGPVAGIEVCEELNIGHSIISRAVFVGMARAVEEMRFAVDAGRAAP
ncbi:MAG: pyridoxine 5'-phosphate synthase [Gemmatimonadota bacterium]